MFENIKCGGCWTCWQWLCMCKRLLGGLWILSLWMLWILWILWLWILWILWLWWLCLCKRLLGGGRPLKSLAAILRCRDDKEIVKINQHRYREDQREEKKIFLLRPPLLLPGWWTDRGDGERDRFHQREHNTTKNNTHIGGSTTQQRTDQREQSKTQNRGNTTQSDEFSCHQFFEHMLFAPRRVFQNQILIWREADLLKFIYGRSPCAFMYIYKEASVILFAALSLFN